MTRVAINGAAGRMGCRLIDLGSKDSGIELCGAIESKENPYIGKDAGQVAGAGEIGLLISDQLAPNTDVVIDFSTPEGTEAVLAACLESQCGLVLATTGFTQQQEDAFHDAAKSIPIVWAPNMSLAVNLAMKLCEVAGGTLKTNSAGVDVEIIERHHRFKKDSPSGTALKFGQVISNVMNQVDHIHGREGDVGERPQNEIGYHAVRAGDDPGQHTIVFGMMGETIEIRVGATNRDCYANGALEAAKWLMGKPPGIYNMNDVLNL